MIQVPPAGCTLTQIVDAVRRLDADTIAREIAGAFLLRQIGQGMTSESGEITGFFLPPDRLRTAAAGVDLSEFRVHALKPSGEKRFGGDYVSIGRSKSNDVVLPDASVSKQHASITQDATGFSIADIGARFGTFVNDVRLETDRKAKALPLRDGDKLRFGDVRVTFVMPAALLAMCQ